MSTKRTIADLREQAMDFIRRNHPELENQHIAERDPVILYMATFAFEVLKLQEANVDWQTTTQ